MKKSIYWVQNYLLCAIPFIVAVYAWSMNVGEKAVYASGSFFKIAAWEVLSWNGIVWAVTLVLFMFAVLLVKPVREQTMRRIANIKERDEREAQITGQAAVSSVISTLSVTVFLLFVTLFTFEVRKLPVDQQVDGKTKVMSLGMNFKPWDESATVETSANESIVSKDFMIIESKSLPLSKSSILLIVVCWQLLSFNYFARKFARVDE